MTPSSRTKILPVSTTRWPCSPALGRTPLSLAWGRFDVLRVCFWFEVRFVIVTATDAGNAPLQDDDEMVTVMVMRMRMVLMMMMIISKRPGKRHRRWRASAPAVEGNFVHARSLPYRWLESASDIHTTSQT